MRSRFLSWTAALAVATTGITMAGFAGPALAVNRHSGKVDLIKVSHDPYDADGAQHATEAEPDTLAWNNTIVSVFQVGRYSGGGSSNTGWATSTDGGSTWKHGFLPKLTVADGGPWARASDPVIAYDAADHRWLAATLVISTFAAGVVVSPSKDGLHWGKPIDAVGLDGRSYDKEWIVCDNGHTKYYGNCYIEADVTSSGNLEIMSTSTDGGKTWGPQKSPADSPSGLGGQPLVQPDGTVVVPYSANFGSQRSFRSTDGGKTWEASVLISTISDHEVPGMREEPLPSASMDARGKIYVVWDDCRFRSGCASNDIVMSTSDDGVTWSDVVRIPIDGRKSGRDHFDPGLGVSPAQFGKHTNMGLYYYFYPDASCDVSQCKLEVGYVSSTNAGKTWSKPTTLAGPMSLSWLAQAGGAMIGDYLSCDILGDTAVSVFAVGFPPHGSKLDQAMYSAGPLPVTGGRRPATAQGIVSSGSHRSHPAVTLS
jgi:hypothetical protein